MNYAAIFRNLVFPFLDSILKRRDTARYIKEYEAQQWASADEIEALAQAKFSNLIDTVSTEVPFYKNLADELGRTPKLCDLPVMTKGRLRELQSDVFNPNFAQDVISKATGGSTGEPFAFEYNTESEERRQAVMWRGYNWAEAAPGARAVYMWADPTAGKEGLPRLKEQIFHRLYNRRYLDVFDITTDSYAQFHQRINQWKPHVIVGYVSAMVEFCEWLAANKLKIPSPHSVVTGAEPLFPFQREILEQQFGAPVFNTYGSREFMLIGAECEQHDGFHISADHLIVEVLDEQDQPVKNQPGKIVITDLHNYRMPLIRYEIGDLGIFSDSSCACGRGLPLLKSVEGRILDVIFSRDGVIPGEFFPHTMKDVVGVEQFQVRQTRKGEVSVAVVGKDADLEHVKNILASPWHGALDVQVTSVIDIPLTAAGKRRVTISELQE